LVGITEAEDGKKNIFLFSGAFSIRENKTMQTSYLNARVKRRVEDAITGSALSIAKGETYQTKSRKPKTMAF
jgi:hypothetical protein